MPRFRLKCPIENARGFQYFEVDAKNEEEALRIHGDGDSVFADDEIEVTSIGEPQVMEMVEEK